MTNLAILLCWLSIGLAAFSLFIIAHNSFLWRHRRTAVDAVFGFLLVGILFAVEAALTDSVMILALYIAAGSVLFLLAARARFGRLHEQFLKRSTRLSVLVSFVFFILAFLYWQFGQGYITPEILAIAVMVGALLTGSLFAVQTVWSLVNYSARKFEKTAPKAEAKHPTVTLAIPARNETHALTSCLEAALQSDYDKLEIIVLDDCSQDNTSQLIRSFAHAGVRFVIGKTPAEGWLGKNQACATLLKEATGKYVIFMGVDTKLESSSISKLVEIAEKQQLEMISVLPMKSGPFHALILRQLRYVWQIVLPLTDDRVPVSGECWLVRRKALEDMGGFAGVKNQIIPEKTFARRLAALSTYRFIVADKYLPLYFEKTWHAQFQNALRLWYPKSRQNPLNVIALALLFLLVGVGPFVAVPFAEDLFVRLLAGVICVLYLATYGVVLRRLQPRLWWLNIWLLPINLLQETVTLLTSMLRYEFSDINWKGRNVCYPVLSQKK